MFVDIDVGCRKCAACLRKRGVAWRERAIRELNAANRSWFGTLTLSPDEHYLSECRAVENFALLPPDQQFSERHRVNGPLLTNYVKRLRKAAGHGLRICIVAEQHKTGLPHYHALVHEPHGVVVRHRQLQGAWTHGFSSWKLVTDNARAARYVAKYLYKSSLARVRASLGYGDPIRALAATGPNEAKASDPVRKNPPPEEVRDRSTNDGLRSE